MLTQIDTQSKNSKLSKAEIESIVDKLLDVTELQEILNLKPKNWIYQKLHTRTLPFQHVKIGHYVRFPLSAVLRYIESQTRPGAAA